MLFMLLLAAGAVEDARWHSVPWWNPAGLLVLAVLSLPAGGVQVDVLYALALGAVWTLLAARGLSGAADPPLVVAALLRFGAELAPLLGLGLLTAGIVARVGGSARAGRVAVYPAVLAAAVRAWALPIATTGGFR